jgi:hypothetical protein
MLIGPLAVGCGLDPSHAPVDAKKDDFCSAYVRLARADAHTSSSDMSDYLNEFARFGTPRGIPTAARNGFEYVIDPDHAFANGREFGELALRTDAVGQDAAALKSYAEQTCGDRS